MDYEDIVEYWFETLEAKDWWRKNESLDDQIRRDYKELHHQVSVNDKEEWRQYDLGRLAEIIVLDQFSRNMFRDTPGAFACDAQALALSKAAVEAGVAGRLDQVRASFLLMPFMHSESLADHDIGLPLFEQYCAGGTLEFERRHREIIERFGRYPHRNEILGRESTVEELAFLGGPGSSF